MKKESMMTRIMNEYVVLKRVTASFLSTIMALTMFFMNSSALAATSDRFPNTSSAAFNLNTTGGLGTDQEPAYSRVFEALPYITGCVRYTAPIDMQVSISTEGTAPTRIDVFNNVDCRFTQQVEHTTDGRDGLVVSLAANQTYWIEITMYASDTSTMLIFNFSAIVERGLNRIDSVIPSNMTYHQSSDLQLNATNVYRFHFVPQEDVRISCYTQGNIPTSITISFKDFEYDGMKIKGMEAKDDGIKSNRNAVISDLEVLRGVPIVIAIASNTVGSTTFTFHRER